MLMIMIVGGGLGWRSTQNKTEEKEEKEVVAKDVEVKDVEMLRFSDVDMLRLGMEKKDKEGGSINI